MKSRLYAMRATIACAITSPIQIKNAHTQNTSNPSLPGANGAAAIQGSHTKSPNQEKANQGKGTFFL